MTILRIRRWLPWAAFGCWAVFAAWVHSARSAATYMSVEGRLALRGGQYYCNATSSQTCTAAAGNCQNPNPAGGALGCFNNNCQAANFAPCSATKQNPAPASYTNAPGCQNLNPPQNSKYCFDGDPDGGSNQVVCVDMVNCNCDWGTDEYGNQVVVCATNAMGAPPDQMTTACFSN